jgi:hypothetical protein
LQSACATLSSASIPASKPSSTNAPDASLIAFGWGASAVRAGALGESMRAVWVRSRRVPTAASADR